MSQLKGQLNREKSKDDVLEIETGGLKIEDAEDSQS